mmetsp:Transcript_77114/g.146754  ORF Transcript_77114/g.146754 Transcript_77114/m.146754 type:complete len:319 (+) Transcript_77114:97-1053(+)
MTKSLAMVFLTLAALGKPCQCHNNASSIDDEVTMLQVSLQKQQKKMEVSLGCRPGDRDACLRSAEYNGYHTGGGGYDFMLTDCSTPGCYGYTEGEYKNFVWFCMDASGAYGLVPLNEPKRRPLGWDCNFIPDGYCEPYSKAACAQAATVAGLQLGGKGYGFEGDYSQKGCYTYESGKYAGHAYYGLGGSYKEYWGELSGGKMRPPGYDCSGPLATTAAPTLPPTALDKYWHFGEGQCTDEDGKTVLATDPESIGWAGGSATLMTLEACAQACEDMSVCAAFEFGLANTETGYCWLFPKRAWAIGNKEVTQGFKCYVAK